MGYSSGHLKPGIRFRFDGPIKEDYSYRFTQRVQYKDGDNFFSSTHFRLSRSIDDNSVVGWSSRPARPKIL
jgi:hypothetical protein